MRMSAWAVMGFVMSMPLACATNPHGSTTEHADKSATGEPAAGTRANSSLAALGRYLDTEVPGLWRDKLDAAGVFAEEPEPNSTSAAPAGMSLAISRA